jgi:hypothetical protein
MSFLLPFFFVWPFDVPLCALGIARIVRSIPLMMFVVSIIVASRVFLC